MQADVETGETSATITDIKTKEDWEKLERIAKEMQGKSEDHSEATV